jgi:hypothetical protein
MSKCCCNCKPNKTDNRFIPFMEIAKICCNERKSGMVAYLALQEEPIAERFYDEIKAHCESIDRLIEQHRLPEALEMIRSLHIILFKAR